MDIIHSRVHICTTYREIEHVNIKTTTIIFIRHKSLFQDQILLNTVIFFNIYYIINGIYVYTSI